MNLSHMNSEYEGSITKVANGNASFTAFLYLICHIAVTGTLKGYDQLLNLVLDEAVEFLRGEYGQHLTLLFLSY